MSLFQIVFPDFGLVEKILRNILVTTFESEMFSRFVQSQYLISFYQWKAIFPNITKNIWTEFDFFFVTNNLKIPITV